MRSELGRLLRFALVGVTNTLLTLASFAVLVRLGVPAPPASAAGFAVGAANGYRLNRAWTFRTTRGGAGTVARYVAVQALGAALSAGGVALVTSDLAVRRLGAECLVLPIVTLVTYVLSRRVVFGAPRLA
jgi:putative flippase GtrA